MFATIETDIKVYAKNFSSLTKEQIIGYIPKKE